MWINAPSYSITKGKRDWKIKKNTREFDLNPAQAYLKINYSKQNQPKFSGPARSFIIGENFSRTGAIATTTALSQYQDDSLPLRIILKNDYTTIDLRESPNRFPEIDIKIQ